MKLNEAIDLAAYKAAFELKKAQLQEAQARIEQLQKTPPPEEKVAQLEKALAAAARLMEQTPQTAGAVLKAGPDPRIIRDALLAAIQKTLVQRLKKFFQGLQLQALRILRGATSDAERSYWEEPGADAEIAKVIDDAIGEVGEAAFSAASREFGVAVAWTAENFWLPQYIGVRADMIKGINANLKAELIAQLREGYKLGEGIPQLSQRVTEVFREAIDWKAERIARTETMQAYGAASLAAYKAGGIEKVRMHDGPHDDKANCIDVDGMVVTIAEATQLMAEEHPNGVRAVAPFMEQWLVPNTNTRAAEPAKETKAPDPTIVLLVEALTNQQKANQQTIEYVMKAHDAQRQFSNEFVLKALGQMVPPDVKVELPPFNLNFNEGAIKSTTNVAEGAIQAAPVTFSDGAIPVTFTDGAIQAHTNFQEGSIKVDPAIVNINEGAVRVETPLMIAKGAIESHTPITVIMPEQPEVVVNLAEEDGDS